MAQKPLPTFAIRHTIPDDFPKETRDALEALKRDLEEGLSHTYRAISQAREQSPTATVPVPYAIRHSGDLGAELIRQTDQHLHWLSYRDTSSAPGSPMTLRIPPTDDDPPGLQATLEALRRQTEKELNRLRFLLLS